MSFYLAYILTSVFLRPVSVPSVIVDIFEFFRCAERFSDHKLIESSQELDELDRIIIPILHARKLNSAPGSHSQDAVELGPEPGPATQPSVPSPALPS